MIIGPFRGEYDFLSNFSSSKIWYDGFEYPTVEHAFQASKTMEYNDRLKIANAKTPGTAKSMGRNVRLRPSWDIIRIPIMLDLVVKKFRISELRLKLLSTGDNELVEINWWGDNFWGVCGKLENGQNNLGKILMQVRENIRNGLL